MRTVKFLFFLLGVFGLTYVIAADSATMSVDSKLYSSTNMQSSVVSTLPQGSEVTIEKRQGGWYQVKNADGKSGWVRSYDVQIAANGNWFSRLKRVVAGGYSTESNASATIGIRGLGPGDVKKAAPNLSELGKLENYKSSLSQGQQYASSVPLKSQQVAYLKPIEKSAAASSSESKPSATSTPKPENNSGGDNDLINQAIDSLW